MTARHLKIFLCVYRENSITAAANKFHISQPAVSVAIKELETHYGVSLFERYGRSLSITPAGELLYQYATQIISGFDEVGSILKDWDKTGVLKLGATITAGTLYMPQLVNQYREISPHTKMYVTTSSTDLIEQKILDNEIDLALSEGIVHSEMINSEPMVEEELGIFCGSIDPIAQKGNVTLQELSEMPLLLRRKNSGTRGYIESLFRLEGINITPVWESIGTNDLVNAAALGLGVTVLPVNLIGEFSKGDQLTRLHLEGMELKRKISIMYHRNKTLSPVILRFIDLCKSMVQQKAALSCNGRGNEVAKD